MAFSRTKDRIELVVGDNGPCLPANATEEDLFKSTKTQGTSLGLFIACTASANNVGCLETGHSTVGGTEFRMIFPKPRR